MSDIYEQHAAAFARVSAFAVMRDGKQVATVAIKFPQDGAGRLYAYVHVIGAHMVRGSASGGGYDKRSAAVYDACKALRHGGGGYRDADTAAAIELFRDAAPSMDSCDWTSALASVGLQAWQVI